MIVYLVLNVTTESFIRTYGIRQVHAHRTKTD